MWKTFVLCCVTDRCGSVEAFVEPVSIFLILLLSDAISVARIWVLRLATQFLVPDFRAFSASLVRSADEDGSKISFLGLFLFRFTFLYCMDLAGGSFLMRRTTRPQSVAPLL